MNAATASHARRPTGSPTRRFVIGLARAFGGALIFSMPIFMTMEMWQLGFAAERMRIAMLVVLIIPVLVGLSHYCGFEPTFDWQDDVVDPQRLVESSLWPNAYQIGEYNFAQIRLPLYQVTRFPLQPPAFQAAGATFGDALTLERAWQPGRATAGDWFYTVLEWQALKPLDADYKVFVHGLDAHGNLAFQSDRLPLNALLPTSRWPRGKTQRDTHAVVIPADLPAGRYRVVAGVYDPATGARLPVGGPLEDAVELGEVEVVRR
jgi:hypothetical protein